MPNIYDGGRDDTGWDDAGRRCIVEEEKGSEARVLGHAVPVRP